MGGGAFQSADRSGSLQIEEAIKVSWLRGAVFFFSLRIRVQLALGERYDTTTNALDLSDFYNDDGTSLRTSTKVNEFVLFLVLRRNGERVILGRANYMEAVLKVIGENCPQVRQTAARVFCNIDISFSLISFKGSIWALIV